MKPNALCKQLCTFRIDELRFGIEATRVQEVLMHQKLTRVPRSPPCVAGLLNLRGRIATAINLRDRLGLPDKKLEFPPTNMVVSVGGGLVSLLVDEIGEIVQPDGDLFENPPQNLSPPSNKLIRGVYKLPTYLLLALDLDATIGLKSESQATVVM